MMHFISVIFNAKQIVIVLQGENEGVSCLARKGRICSLTFTYFIIFLIFFGVNLLFN